MELPLNTSEASLRAIQILHYVYPPALFFWFILSHIHAAATLANLKSSARYHRHRLAVILQFLVVVSYVSGPTGKSQVAEAMLIVARTWTDSSWWASQHDIVYNLATILVWGLLGLVLHDQAKPVWYPYYGSWFLSAIFEACLLGLGLPAMTMTPSKKFETTRFGIQAFRLSVFLGMPFALWAINHKDVDRMDEESTPLLNPELTQPSTYSSIPEGEGSDEEATERKEKENLMRKLEESGNWYMYAKSFSALLPHFFPRDLWLSFMMTMVGVCLIIERALNVMIPHQIGVVTTLLMQGNGYVPWRETLLYVFYKWIAGSCIGGLRRQFWMPIALFSYRSLTTAAYNHAMLLSYDFHSGKSSSDINTDISRGNSVNGFVDTIAFQIAPMLSDLCIAFGYFFFLFDSYMALVVAVVSVMYIYISIKQTAAQIDIRKTTVDTYRDQSRIMNDTLRGWTTVSYFGRVPYEQERFRGALVDHQTASRNLYLTWDIQAAIQDFIFSAGLLSACFIAIYEVAAGSQPVSSFVTLLTYWSTLSSPLYFFGGFYRHIQEVVLDTERLLALLREKPTIVNRPGAIELGTVDGTVVFENVCFSYDPRKPALSDISFRVPAGSTVAFVGETGGGKTTCLRLLFRFYDVSSGAIKVDGHDIRDIKLDNLRNHIGVVPQDPELFNTTILSNLKYANLEASDEEVYEACRAASIHDKILSFPDGYLSKVGERGVKLSGGEMQRVAIARAMLKNPKIILLDEATSMIDLETERKIQGAFRKLAQDRTMFLVAHRLSTVKNADLIIVIKDGQLVEKGNHEQLLHAKGRYAKLWSSHLSNEQAELGKKQQKFTTIDDLFKDQDDEAAGELQSEGNSNELFSGQPEATCNGRAKSASGMPENCLNGVTPLGIAAQLQGQAPTIPRVSKSVAMIAMSDSPAELADYGSQSTDPRKPTSSLKPNAKEFIPKGLSVSSPDASSTLQKENVSPSTAITIPTNNTALAQDTNPTISGKAADSEGLLKDPDSYPTEDVSIMDTETEQNGSRRRRRRTRRRSHKPSPSECDLQINVQEDDKADKTGGSLPMVIGLSSEIQEAEGSNKKPKRRFRSGSLNKMNGAGAA